MVFKTIIKRIVDAILMWIVFKLCLHEYSYVVTDMETKYKLIEADSFQSFLILLSISMLIGIVQIVAIKKGWIKSSGKSELSLGKRVKNGFKWLVITILKATLLAVALMFFGKWLLDHVDISRKTYHMIYLVYIIVLSLCIQAVIMGRRCLIGKLFYWIGYGISALAMAVVAALGGVIAAVAGFIELMREVLGKRIMLGISELLVLLVSVLLIFGFCNKIEYVEEYVEEQIDGRPCTISTWYENNEESYKLDKLGLDPKADGWFGRFCNKEIKSGTYFMMDAYLAWAGIAGILLMLLGQGITGVLCHRLIGWNDKAFTDYDNTHSETWHRVRNADGTESGYMTNWNPHGLVFLFLFVFSIVIGFVSGIFLPICIIGNFIIGLIMLIVRLVSNNG